MKVNLNSQQNLRKCRSKQEKITTNCKSKLHFHCPSFFLPSNRFHCFTHHTEWLKRQQINTCFATPCQSAHMGCWASASAWHPCSCQSLTVLSFGLCANNWQAGPFLSPNPSCGFRNPSTLREHLLPMRGHAPRQQATPTFFHKCVKLLLPKTHHNKWARQEQWHGRLPGAGLQFAYFQKRVTVLFVTTRGDITQWHYYCCQASDSAQRQGGKPVQQVQYSFKSLTAGKPSQNTPHVDTKHSNEETGHFTSESSL